jgi:hypothetical protein
MPHLTVIVRLAVRDLRRRGTEAVLLFLAITAATTTIAVGLSLHGVTKDPYDATRAATRGPDVVARLYPDWDTGAIAAADLAGLRALAHHAGVSAASGPFPTTWNDLRFAGRVAGDEIEGRDTATDAAATPVDQPAVRSGTWLTGPGTVVVEHVLATALHVRPGDTVTLKGGSFRVVGTAVTAAVANYPAACLSTCEPTAGSAPRHSSGLVWVTQDDARALADASQPLYYRLDLRLTDPATGDGFPGGDPSPVDPMPVSLLRREDARLTDTTQAFLLTGGSLLILLAVASVAVLVGGRMADQVRRVGLLKAVGGTPRLVAAVLLAEYLALGLLADAAGLGIARVVAPLFTGDGDGLLGGVAAPSVTLADAGIVTGVALLVSVLASFGPAIRAARISVVRALNAGARPPKRRRLVNALSRRLPVALLLGMRLTARRPRRFVLSVLSIAVTGGGVFGVLATSRHLGGQRYGGAAGLDNPENVAVDHILLLLTVLLVILAAVNAVFIAWASVLDGRPAASLARALGASRREVTAALVSAQVLPAACGAVLSVPTGVLLLVAANHTGHVEYPPLWQTFSLVVASVLVTAALTALPARRAAAVSSVWATSP